MLELLLDHITVLCTQMPLIVTDRVAWSVGLSPREPGCKNF